MARDAEEEALREAGYLVDEEEDEKKKKIKSKKRERARG